MLSWLFIPFAGCPLSESNADDLVDILLERTRLTGAPSSGALGRIPARLLLTHAHNAWNSFRRLQLRSDNLTVTAGTPFYAVDTNLARAGRIIAVRDGTRDLDWVPWRSALRLRDHVLRHAGDRAESWSMVGRDLLVVLPPLRTSATLSVVSVEQRPDLGAADCADLADTEIGPALILAEALLALAKRDVTGTEEAIARFGREMSRVTGQQAITEDT